jgi:hypothetical protein
VIRLIKDVVLSPDDTIIKCSSLCNFYPKLANLIIKPLILPENSPTF